MDGRTDIPKFKSRWATTTTTKILVCLDVKLLNVHTLANQLENSKKSLLDARKGEEILNKMYFNSCL